MIKNSKNLYALFFIAFLADVFLWRQISINRDADRVGDYFLNVGEGDSEVLVLPADENNRRKQGESTASIIIDSGPDDSVMKEVENIIPVDDRYIDVAIATGSETENTNGFNFLLDHYKVGIFIWNGSAKSSSTQWHTLLGKINSKKIPMVALSRGDKIQYGKSGINILWPDIEGRQNKNANDDEIVGISKIPDMQTLFMAGVDMSVEKQLLKNKDAIRATIIKIGHNGAKTSSGANFLHAVDPDIAVIESGANRYKYPASETLDRIASSTQAQIFRTDKDGTIRIEEAEGKIEVTKYKG